MQLFKFNLSVAQVPGGHLARISSCLHLQSPERILAHSRHSRDICKRNKQRNEFTCFMCSFIEISGSQPRVILLPQEHLALSEYTFGCKFFAGREVFLISRE